MGLFIDFFLRRIYINNNSLSWFNHDKLIISGKSHRTRQIIIRLIRNYDYYALRYDCMELHGQPNNIV